MKEIKPEKDPFPNKFTWKDVKGFTPCKLCGCEYSYTHFHDCKQSGCEGHIAQMSYESTSDIFSFDFGDGTVFNLDKTQMDIINDFIERLKD